MASEGDFLTILEDNNRDWQTRLIFADWLDEHDDPRAEGYRALGFLRLWPYKSILHKYILHTWTRSDNPHIHGRWSDGRELPPWSRAKNWKAYRHAGLPVDWYLKLPRRQEWWTEGFETRTEASNAAALAFVELPEDRRWELLNDQPPQLPSEPLQPDVS